jgi:hypothetical protein
MKDAVKRIIRKENGHGLDLVLILLGVGGLVLAPLLGLMSTGLLAGQVYEKKTDELYAADAGVEDAVWRIQQQVEQLPAPGCGGQEPEPWVYNITDDVNKIDGKDVEVTITWVDNMTYRVDSLATGNTTGTRIEAYVTGESLYGDYGALLQHVLISPGPVNVANKVVVDPPDPYPTDPNGTWAYYDRAWPQAWELEDFYGDQVEGGSRYYSNTVIDIGGVNTMLGSLYVDGELNILNSSNTPATLTLNGTVYATGLTQIGANGKDFTLCLNGQTIFVSSNVTDNQYALTIGGKCILKGPGAIIGMGDVQLKPKSQVGAQEGGGPVFVLSVIGTTYLQPSGTVYGSIAGSVEVYVQQGESPTVQYPVGGYGDYNLNFLTGIRKLVYSIASWEVSAA